MCGIAGFLDCSGVAPRDSWPSLLTSMAGALQHRGPDDGGSWSDPEAGVGLAFRRLAIIDLSSRANQPMHSSDGRYVIVFNGEIYNFRELRAELEAAGHPFRTTSDTEVLLAAAMRWGVESAVARFNGMFAFAIWDRQTRRLHLARDRMGEKPLYYGWSRGVFLFGSELHALRRHPAFDDALDTAAMSQFLAHGYVPGPRSIHSAFRKVPPATMLTVDPANPAQHLEPHEYWSLRDIARQGDAHPFEGSEDEALEQLDTRMIDAVRMRMIADVPLGAFLSGGIDSSLIVSLMKAAGTNRVRTFTIGFREPRYDEAEHAAAVARHLGTEHHEWYVTSKEALDVIPLLPSIYDEPFADSSQIPTYLVARMARQHVTVSLSGDGGDELFAGYRHYGDAMRRWRRVRTLPGPIRRKASRGIALLSPDAWDRVWSVTRHFAPPALRRKTNAGIELHRLGGALGSDDVHSFYRRFISQWQGDAIAAEVDDAGAAPPPLHDPVHAMMYADMTSYLPDDILVKLDRATMAVSLEGRVPFLDPNVIELAWRLPLSMKRRDGVGKSILRRLLTKRVPAGLVERPKMGFGVPIDEWLRGPLRDWAEDLLSGRQLDEDGLLNGERIRKRWQEHLAGRGVWHIDLWNVLMLQAWRRSQVAAVA